MFTLVERDLNLNCKIPALTRNALEKKILSSFFQMPFPEHKWKFIHQNFEWIWSAERQRRWRKVMIKVYDLTTCNFWVLMSFEKCKLEVIEKHMKKWLKKFSWFLTNLYILRKFSLNKNFESKFSWKFSDINCFLFD